MVINLMMFGLLAEHSTQQLWQSNANQSVSVQNCGAILDWRCPV
jgi:hypothetical protein